MDRIVIWYQQLPYNKRITVTAVAIATLVIALSIVAYFGLVPRKVTVRYGTIVRDPIDGHVWEDKTKTKVVPSDEAAKYQVTYEDKLSAEHQAKKEEEAAQQVAAAAQANQPTGGLEQIKMRVTDQNLQDITTMQQNVDVIGNNLVKGFQISNSIQQTRNTLSTYRNQLASTAVPAAIDPIKQQSIQVFDKLIQACDLYIRGIANADWAAFRQANALVNEAMSQVSGIIPQMTQ